MKAQTKKPRMMGRLRVAVIALAVVVVIAGLALWVRSYSGATSTTSSAGTTTQASTMTRTNEGGQVTIRVTWQGKSAGPVFAVALDTHAVDLDGYDLRHLAVLRTDKGQELQPASWNAPTGGHHRSGMLTFPATLADGTAVIGTNTRSIELIIRNVAGIPERTFQWTL